MGQNIDLEAKKRYRNRFKKYITASNHIITFFLAINCLYMFLMIFFNFLTLFL